MEVKTRGIADTLIKRSPDLKPASGGKFRGPPGRPTAIATPEEDPDKKPLTEADVPDIIKEAERILGEQPSFPMVTSQLLPSADSLSHKSSVVEQKDITDAEPVTMSALIQRVEDLSARYNNDAGGESLRVFATEALALRQQLANLLPEKKRIALQKLPLSMSAASLFEDKGSAYLRVTELAYDALNKIPIQDLTKDEYDTFMSLLADHYDDYRKGLKDERGAYWFGSVMASMAPNVHSSAVTETLIKMSAYGNLPLEPENVRRVISLQEQEEAAQEQADVYKLHLNVPRDQKIEVLQSLLSGTKKGDIDTLIQWKMQGSLDEAEEARMADFVFYMPSKDSLVRAGKQIAQHIRLLNLPPQSRMPRYSMRVIIEGQEISGLSFCQGDGDFKDWVINNGGGEEMLSKDFDPAQNFAVKKGTRINF